MTSRAAHTIHRRLPGPLPHEESLPYVPDSVKNAGTSRNRVLVVDDEEPVRAAVGRMLELNGFSVSFATNREQALALATSLKPEQAVIDLMLGDTSGLDLITEFRKLVPHTRIVLMTGFGSVSTAVKAIRLGAADYLLKPIDPDELLTALDPSKPREPSKERPDIPTLERAQWEYIQRVVEQCAGNISAASRRLGLHRQSLQRMLKRHPPRK